MVQREAPLHQQAIKAHLSKELRASTHTRALRVRTGDTVKVIRGSYQGKEGLVEKVLTKKKSVIITGVDKTKRNGGKTTVPISITKIVITQLKQDPRRMPQTPAPTTPHSVASSKTPSTTPSKTQPKKQSKETVNHAP